MFQSFCRNKSGNVAIIFALTLLPSMMAIGAAIDYARFASVKAAVQAQVDRAALQAIANVRDPDALLAIENALAVRLAAIAYGPVFDIVKVTQTSADTDAEAIVEVKAEGSVETVVMNVAGFDTLPVGVVAEAKRSPKTYEVSLVVDVTGSMKGTKINALRDASRAFVKALLPEATTSDRILVNIVPYTAAVNVGRRRTDWLRPLPTSSGVSNPPGSSRFANRYIWEGGNAPGRVAKDDCRGTGVVWNDGLDICYIGNLTQWTGADCPGVARNGICYVADGWAGCVEERGRGGDDVTDAPLSTNRFDPYFWASWGGVGNASGNTRYNSYLPVRIDETRHTNATSNDGIGPNLGCPKSEITDWTNDGQYLLDQISLFEAWHRGGTMGHVGLAWGWRTLSPKWAGEWGGAEAPRPYDRSRVEKIAVFMTDGVNGFYTGHAPSGDSDYTAYGRLSENAGVWSGNQQNHLDAKMLAVCNGMRSDGIEIFTVGFGLANNAGGNEARALLRNCASTSEHFFDATTSNLSEYFKNIATNIRTRGERLAL